MNLERHPRRTPVSPDDLRVPVGAGGWTYVWDHPRKPHAHPIATPSGFVLSQVEPADHPWQRGLWFVVKYVDGDNFWEELPRSWDPAGYGVQRHVERPRHDGDTIVGDLEWVRPDRTTVALREHREMRTVVLDDDAYALDWDVTLTAPSDAVLDRTPHDGTWGGYSGLAFRGRAEWTDTRLLLDDDDGRPGRAPTVTVVRPVERSGRRLHPRPPGERRSPGRLVRDLPGGRRLRRGLGEHRLPGVPLARPDRAARGLSRSGSATGSWSTTAPGPASVRMPRGRPTPAEGDDRSEPPRHPSRLSRCLLPRADGGDRP